MTSERSPLLTPVAIRIDRTMVIPWSNVILMMGIVLDLMQQWPIFGFLQGASQNWLLVSNILLIIMLALIPAVFIPHNKKVESLFAGRAGKDASRLN